MDSAFFYAWFTTPIMKVITIIIYKGGNENVKRRIT